MTSAKERFKGWRPMRNSDDQDEAFEAGYAAGAEDMRNRCVTRAILELKGEPSMVHVAEMLAALPAEASDEHT